MRHSFGAALAIVVLGIGGCGYTTRGLYPEDIRTVAVPVVKSNRFRRDVEVLLTERIVQMIESRSPLKVVSEESADTVLRCEISDYYKQSYGEDGFDNPRGGSMVLAVNVSWIDNRTGETLNQNKAPFRLYNYSAYAIDTAQSSATAINDVVDDLANQIVNLMQAPW